MSRPKNNATSRLLLQSAIVGLLGAAAPAVHAYTVTSVTNIGNLASNSSIINSHGGISDTGQASSVFYNGSQYQGYIYTPGSGSTLTGFLPGGTRSAIFGVNGTTGVGYGTNSSNATVPVMYSGGTLTALNIPGVTSGYAYGINSAGTITGYASVATGTYAYTYTTTDGYKSLGTSAGYDSSYGYGINASGHVVGYEYSSTTNANDAFLYTSNGMQDLGNFANGTSSSAFAVNATDEVVGYGTNTASGGYNQAFIYTPAGGMIDIGTLSGAAGAPGTSEALGVNDNGVVVGYATYPGAPSRSYHAFVYDNGVMTDLNTLVNNPAINLVNALAISNNGEIVALGTMTGSTAYQLFLINAPAAVPEPASLGLLGCGAVLMLRRRRNV